MEKTKEENDEIYILGSKKNIDIFIRDNQYNKAYLEKVNVKKKKRKEKTNNK